MCLRQGAHGAGRPLRHESVPCTLRPLQFHLPVLRCVSNPQPQLSASHAGSHAQPTQLNKHVAPAAKGSAAPPACIATSTAHLSTLALPAQCRPKRTTANEDALRQRPAVPLEIVLQELACRVGGYRASAQGSGRRRKRGAALAEWGRPLPALACSARRWAFTAGASGLQLRAAPQETCIHALGLPSAIHRLGLSASTAPKTWGQCIAAYSAVTPAAQMGAGRHACHNVRRRGHRANGGPWHAAVTVIMPAHKATLKRSLRLRAFFLLRAGQQPTGKGAAAKCSLGGVG